VFKRVIWATDGSDDADLALPVAKTLAADSGGALLVIHCQERTLPGKGGGRLPRNANEDELAVKIEGQVKDLISQGISATLQMITTDVGEAAETIADAARSERADVIVVGTRGHTTLAGLLVGSVTQKLLHNTPCPLLAVPVPDRHHSPA
jgi:nucleotide-binding universal stress UspA family protein